MGIFYRDSTLYVLSANSTNSINNTESAKSNNSANSKKIHQYTFKIFLKYRKLLSSEN